MNSEDNKAKRKVLFILSLLTAVCIVLMVLSISAIIRNHGSEAEYVKVESPADTPASPAVTAEPVPCSHHSHDTDGLCTLCGEKLCHEYIGGVCSCGKQFEPETGCMDESLWLPCSHCGTVRTLEYQTRDEYYGGDRLYTKTLDVYLPYGYSVENRYNVLILLHGTGGNSGYWFSEERGYHYGDGRADEWGSFATVIDNMIEYRLCEPLIIVSPTYYLTDSERHSGDDLDRDITRMRYETVNSILPFIIENFSTYAEGSTYSEMCAARNHFGFIGASYGGILAYKSILTYDIDVFSWIGSISGGLADAAYIDYTWNHLGFDGLGIDCLYNSAGDRDSMRKDALQSYYAVLSLDRLSEANCCMCTIENASHEDRVWDNGVYNCLQFFFAGYD